MKLKTSFIVVFLFFLGFKSSLVLAQTTRIVPIEAAIVGQGAQLDLGYIVSSMLNVAISLGFLALFFYFIRAAYQWLTAGGDKAQVEQARNGITNGLIGMALLASVFALFSLIDNFFGIGITGNTPETLENGYICEGPNCDCTEYWCDCGGIICDSVCVDPSEQRCI